MSSIVFHGTFKQVSVIQRFYPFEEIYVRIKVDRRVTHSNNEA